MSKLPESALEVFSVKELAVATGASLEEVTAWVETGAIRTLPTGDGTTWLSGAEAIRAGHAILTGTLAVSLPTQADAISIFTSRFTRPASARALRGPLAVSSSLHAGVLAAAVLATTLGLGQASVSPTTAVEPEPMRLVYLAMPGPGGGGGGGGLRQKLPPPRAERKGNRSLNSPLPVREEPKLPEPVEKPREPEPQPIKPEPLPPVLAPIVTAPSDEKDRPGVLDKSPTVEESRGPGEGGGVGTGQGTGLGKGEGAGIGEGSGGGIGGGPYRPGSGIQPPTLLREVKPDYTEDARRGGVEGDVVMEIVVRRDGTVGEVRVLQGLGHGLNERAVAAVRQWRFNPAKRRGAPVDVMVEVAMEFKLR